jgi:hypothetical protein
MKPKRIAAKTTNENLETQETTMTTNKKQSTNKQHHTHDHKEMTMKTKTIETSHATTIETPNAMEVAAQPTLASRQTIPEQLHAIEQRCGYGEALGVDDRNAAEKLIGRVPSSIIAHVMMLAVRGAGVVAGIKLDPDATKAALAAADEADAVATAAQILARRAADQAVRLRAAVVGDVSAIRMALRGYVKTKQGASLKQANDELRALAKQHAAAAKARKTRAKNGVKETPPPVAPNEPTDQTANEAPIKAAPPSASA